MKKLILVILIIIIGFLFWKYGINYIQNSNSIIKGINDLKSDIETSINNLKHEGEQKLKQAEDLKNKAENKVDKFNKAVDAVNELTK